MSLSYITPRSRPTSPAFGVSPSYIRDNLHAKVREACQVRASQPSVCMLAAWKKLQAHEAAGTPKPSQQVLKELREEGYFDRTERIVDENDDGVPDEEEDAQSNLIAWVGGIFAGSLAFLGLALSVSRKKK